VDGVATLLDQSLVHQIEGLDSEPRFTMLETIREYALERLAASGEAEAIRRQHAQYYLALAEAVAPGLWGDQQHQGSVAQLEPEHDNLRAALAWSQGPAGSAETGLRLAGALAGFWTARGYLNEGRAWLAGALAQPEAAAPSLARAEALRRAGVMAEGSAGAAHAFYEESLALFRALGDRRGSAATLADRGRHAWFLGDYARAAMLCEESLALFREIGDRYGSAHALTWLAAAARDQGDYVRALALFAESLALWRALGDKVGIANTLNGMGDAMRDQGDYMPAAALYQEALALNREREHMVMSAIVQSNLGRVLHAQGNDVQAVALIEESVAWLRDVGHTWNLAWVLQHLSAVVYAQGDGRARAVLREALVAQQRQGYKGMIAGSLERFAGLAARQGQPEQAARLFGAAEALRAALGAPLPPAERAAYEHDVAATRAQLDAAAFAAAWADGRALPLHQAIADALSEDG
jgi:tetratricopeptide (TPR) repeat protein